MILKLLNAPKNLLMTKYRDITRVETTNKFTKQMTP